MPQIELEPFSPMLVPVSEQADRLWRLVDENRDWLPDTPYAEALSLYGNIGSAAMSVIRMANRGREVHSYIVRVNPVRKLSPAAGIATIIRHQGVYHPETGHTVKGAYLDYWLGSGSEQLPGIHRTVASRLVRNAISLARTAGPDGQITVFATIDPDQSHRPEGLTTELQPYGGPTTRLRISEPYDPSDPHRILRGGHMLQLYMHQSPAQVSLIKES
ncbi:MAG: hypothetical protein JWL85_484 [Candidatus Saccharibacteria bacterium]|nr:hypothetical protein [Candidatus Saccharibacteria bacterium]